jgi:hypothetical protein
MKHCIILFALILLFIGCINNKSIKGKTGNKIKGIAIVTTFSDPLYDMDHDPVFPPELIYYYKDYIVYPIAQKTTDNFFIQTKDSVIRSKIPNGKPATYYYIRRNTDSVIYKLDSISDPEFKKMSVEVLYKKSSVYRQSSFDSKKFLSQAKKVETKEVAGFFVEKYVMLKHSATDADSAYLYYGSDNFWKSIPYNFSKDFPVKNERKLVKLTMLANPDPLAKDSILKHGFSATLELKEQSIENEKPLLNLLARFESFLKNNK